MTLHRVPFLLLITAAFAPMPAQADDTKSEPIHYDFGDDLVRGAGKSSSGEVLFVRPRRDRESLVRAREHWLPELFRSVENF
jgi:hypothetical protein